MSSFRYCLNSSTIRPTPVLEKIRITAQAGYEGIELWHDDMESFIASGGSIHDIAGALRDHGLTVPTTIYLKGWADEDDAARRVALDECRRRMEQAVIVGAGHVIACPPLGFCDHAFVGQRYAELLDIGLQLGVKPAFEYLGFVADFNNISSAIEVMEASAHPSASIILDPFHCFRGGEGFEALARLPAHQIAISHFNDTPIAPAREEQHDHHRVMPGDGHLDLHRYLTLLKGTGYRGWLSLELFNEELWRSDPLTVARLGLERMRSVAGTV